MPNSLSKLVDATLVIEKLRVASQVRQSHLALQDRIDSETDELLNRIQGLEEYVDGRIADLIKTHPAYPWFSRVKGIGRENIGKVVGSIRVRPELSETKKRCSKCLELVKIADQETHRLQPTEFASQVIYPCIRANFLDYELPYADTISALWAYCGYAVVDGHAPKRVKGEGKLTYNSQLRSMCWRLGGSLMRAQGKFYAYYLVEKAKYVERFEKEGRKVVPAASLPKTNGKKEETAEFISEGHVHLMALRKTIKAFLACLYIEWCQAEGIPVRPPYAIEKLGHSHQYEPEDFTDR